MELVGRLSGVGKAIRDHMELGSARYEILVYQEFIDGGSRRIPGMRELTGTVDAPVAPYQAFTLVTEEGHRLEIYTTTDAQGSFELTGDFVDANGNPVKF